MRRTMVDPIYLRMFGYVASFTMHSANAVDVFARLAVTSKDPIVKEFATLQFRFFTNWTMGFQMAYALLGLSCDVLTLVKSDFKYVNNLNKLRNSLFTALLWPSSLMVSAVFWPIYIYNPYLVFPVFIDKILSPVNNHIMHSAIVPVAVWERLFLQSHEPRSHLKNVLYMSSYTLLYYFVLINTYTSKGVWPYPICDTLNGTIYLPILLTSVLFLAIGCYYLQWPIARFMSRSGKERKTA